MGLMGHKGVGNEQGQYQNAQQELYRQLTPFIPHRTTYCISLKEFNFSNSQYSQSQEEACIHLELHLIEVLLIDNWLHLLMS